VTVSDIITHLRSGVGSYPELKPDDAVQYIDDLFAQLDQEQARVTAGENFRALAERFAKAPHRDVDPQEIPDSPRPN